MDYIEEKYDEKSIRKKVSLFLLLIFMLAFIVIISIKLYIAVKILIIFYVICAEASIYVLINSELKAAR